MSSSSPGPEFRSRLLGSKATERDMNSVMIVAKDLLKKEISRGRIKLKNVTACACGSENLEQLSSVDRFGLNFGSLICRECGLVLTNPRIAEESLPEYYNRIYHPLNFGQDGLEELPFLFAEDQGQKIFKLTRDRLNQYNKLRILEIGSGTGSVLQEFVDNSQDSGFTQIEAVGTEYSEECLKIARDRIDGRPITYIYGGLQDVLDQDTGGFDLIILSHVFEHFISLDKELGRIGQLLKPDGFLYIEVPGIFQIHKARQYGFSFLGYLIHAHIYNFTASSLANIVCANGYKLEYINENVEAIFRKGSVTGSKSSVNHAYRDILFYLELLDRDREYFTAQLETEKALRTDLSFALRDNHEKAMTIQSLTENVNQLTERLERYTSFLPIRIARKIYRKLPKKPLGF